MGLLDSYKANKAISAILAAGDISSPDARHALLRLKQIGAPAIPRLLEAIPGARNTAPIEAALKSFLDEETLPLFLEGLEGDDPHIVRSVQRVLSASTQYDPNRLLELLQESQISRKVLGEILEARAQHLNHRALFALAGKVPSNTRPVIYRLIDQVVTPSDLPNLLEVIEAAEPGVRTRLTKLLARLENTQSRDALVRLLEDPDKRVRQAALEALATIKVPVSTKAVVQLLRDPDVMVQAQAIETLVTLRDAATVQYLIEILQDESEYVRRAAVEVLNEVGDQRAIKDLLSALRDKDWWVKVRAADALGKIGGPRVVEAILNLIKDPDEFLRRTAVEILNSSKDDRAYEFLVEALEDKDWWVRERAADALAALGGERGLQPLYAMLRQGPEKRQAAIRALTSIQDKGAIDLLVEELDRGDADAQLDALRGLEKLTDAEHAELVHGAVTRLISISDQDVDSRAREVAESLARQFRDSETGAGSGARAAPVEGGDDEQVFDLSPDQDESAAKVDVSQLQAGDVISQRYRVLKKVGKGGFGEVVLVEDMVVNEQLILKFLNPNVASDENAIKRFIQELRYARKITHENVIRIYDFITFSNVYAISMEYFPSHSLADELARKESLGFDRIVDIAVAVARGMAAAEQVGVVHRDLKPANILINDGDQVKIVDYGLAAAASQGDSRLTKSGILIGTPTYMSPEQARGDTVDSRTDIYSLGVIMYEMVTGHPPYSGETAVATLLRHLEGKAAPPSLTNPDIPPALEEIIMKAIAAERDDRYSGFDELRTTLEALNRGKTNAAN